MRNVKLKHGKFILEDEVEFLLEREIKPFGTSAKADVPKRFLRKRAYVLILKD